MVFDKKRTVMKWDLVDRMVEKTIFYKSVTNHVESSTSITNFELLIIQWNTSKFMKFLVRYNFNEIFQENHRNLRWKER